MQAAVRRLSGDLLVNEHEDASSLNWTSGHLFLARTEQGFC